MNFDLKYKKITYIILLVIAISVILTAVIVGKMMKETANRIAENWFFEESVTTGQPVILQDAFILSNEEGVLCFIYDHKTYEVTGNLEEDYFGVANITVNGDAITMLGVKPDSVEDVLVSYTENDICLENNGAYGRKPTIAIYKVNGEEVSQVEWNSFMLGVSKVRCVMDQGEVSAILIEEDVLPGEVRVLIKNGNEIFYPKLYVQQVSDGVIVDVEATMTANQIQTLDLEDANGLILCDGNGQALGTAYEGKFHIVWAEEGFVLVNEVPMETYVKYVLPSEMQTTFGMEALKAQAVCARTYAYSQMRNQSYARFGANLDDSTAFQVYHRDTRYPQTDQAVEETAGEVITCNGELITCYYYSTSPGVTNDMTTWENENPLYISSQSGDAFQGLDLTATDDFSAYMRMEQESFDSASSLYRWNAILDISEAKEEYGALQSLQVLERNQAGYVTELSLVYENETRTIKNENTIRTILGMYLQETIQNDGSIRTNFSMIPSACFEVLEQSDGKIVLRGGGFGHGIGMSQYGANAMSEAGYGYKEIIDYYYSNVTVKTL